MTIPVDDPIPTELLSGERTYVHFPERKVEVKIKITSMEVSRKSSYNNSNHIINRLFNEKQGSYDVCLVQYGVTKARWHRRQICCLGLVDGKCRSEACLLFPPLPPDTRNVHGFICFFLHKYKFSFILSNFFLHVFCYSIQYSHSPCPMKIPHQILQCYSRRYWISIFLHSLCLVSENLIPTSLRVM